MIDTKDRILDAAERLFGEQGYAATSLRHIIADAGVNLAAIHYHFGSKEELLGEVIMRNAAPVNETRLAMLDRFDAEASPAPAPVEQVLEAFLAPMAEVAACHPQFVKVMGRMHAEGLMPTIIRRHFHTVVERFHQALRRALPELPEDELMWRVHFMTGAMAHATCAKPVFEPPGYATEDMRRRLERLVAFLSGGFRAPALAPEQAEVTQ
ncbi:MAG: TetR family transcriptional regulator [Acidobacteriia bacterium]|nr:TetR family transcriptional regulator [Terriglobia bacterium]